MPQNPVGPQRLKLHRRDPHRWSVDFRFSTHPGAAVFSDRGEQDAEKQATIGFYRQLLAAKRNVFGCAMVVRGAGRGTVEDWVEDYYKAKL